MKSLIKSLRVKYGGKNFPDNYGESSEFKDFDDLGGGVKRFVIESSKAIDKRSMDAFRSPGANRIFHVGDDVVHWHHGAGVSSRRGSVIGVNENDNTYSLDVGNGQTVHGVHGYNMAPANRDVRRGIHPQDHPDPNLRGRESTGGHQPSHLPPVHPDDKGLKRFVIESKAAPRQIMSHELREGDLITIPYQGINQPRRVVKVGREALHPYSDDTSASIYVHHVPGEHTGGATLVGHNVVNPYTQSVGRTPTRVAGSEVSNLEGDRTYLDRDEEVYLHHREPEEPHPEGVKLPSVDFDAPPEDYGKRFVIESKAIDKAEADVRGGEGPNHGYNTGDVLEYIRPNSSFRGYHVTVVDPRSHQGPDHMLVQLGNYEPFHVHRNHVRPTEHDPNAGRITRGHNPETGRESEEFYGPDVP